MNECVIRNRYGDIVGTMNREPNYLGNYIFKAQYGNITATVDSTPNYIGDFAVRDFDGNILGYKEAG